MLTPEQFRRHNFSINALGFYKADDVDSFLSEAADSYEQVVAECNSLRQKMGFLAQKLEDYRQDEGALGAALLVAQRTADKMIKDAQEQADKLKDEANENAESMILDAKRYSEQTLGDAASKAQDMTSHAQAEAEKKIKEATESAQAAINFAETQAQEILSDAEKNSMAKLEKAEREAEEIIYKATGKAQEDLKVLTADVEKEKIALEAIRRESDGFRSQLMNLYRAHIELINKIPQYETEEQAQSDEVEETAPDDIEEVIDEPSTEDSLCDTEGENVSGDEENNVSISESASDEEDYSSVIESASLDKDESESEQNEGFHLNLDELD